MAIGRNRPISVPILGSLSKDVAAPSDGEDTVSSLSWSPAANHLAAASWDGAVRIYDVASNGSAIAAAKLLAEGPVLDCDWAKDGSMVLVGGADKKLHLLHLPTGQQATVGIHGAPVRSVRFVDIPASNGPIVASGSWDQTVKYWDLRQQNPVAALACQERVYAMDAKAQLLVIATADRQFHLVDLKDPTRFLRTQASALPCQTKAVAAFPDGKGWGYATIEGRCGINALDEKKDSNTNFTFRCHRAQSEKAKDTTEIWAANSIQFHPTLPPTFTTGGSDGTFCFWDRIAHSKLRAYPSVGNPITTTAFNRDGSFFAYASGYDWSQGHAGNSTQIQTKVTVHPVTEEDATPRKK
ncbi:WD repeat domain-containing protein [Xylariaceae sp. FL0016]|nr:WD repeat domain-containing protein [Xylariaceae sp. FL0016]